jgi:hypothetical protein
VGVPLVGWIEKTLMDKTLTPEEKEWNRLGPEIFWLGIGYILVQTSHPIFGYGLLGLSFCRKHPVRMVLFIKMIVVVILLILIMYFGER